MLHLDLFGGIGGFAYAVDRVWPDAEHIFCDNDKFCQQVLKKHWPNSKIYEDIRAINNTEWERLERHGGDENNAPRREGQDRSITKTTCELVTGGFPCQPFSQAGRRKGTDDNRYLWPEMLRVIQLTNPTWVIAENVRGLLTINEGLVFEQVCLDLEASGYEVQPFIIPAVSVNAPHRRDRVWIVANKQGKGLLEGRKARGEIASGSARWRGSTDNGSDVAYATLKQLEGRDGTSEGRVRRYSEWDKNWLEVATELCGVDARVSAGVDGFSPAQHRVQRIKSLGNAIVPAVAIEIMKGIKNT